MFNVSKFQLHTCILSYTLRDLLSICLHGSYGVPMAGATSAVAISPLGRRCKSVSSRLMLEQKYEIANKGICKDATVKRDNVKAKV